MKSLTKVLSIVVLSVALLACGGGGTTSVVTPSVPCSLDTRETVSNHPGDITIHDVTNNTCNELTEYTYSGGVLTEVEYTIDDHLLVSGFKGGGTSTMYLTYRYTHVDGEDFITRYDNFTTNTDIFFSHEDEYKFIVGYSALDGVLEDISELHSNGS